MKSVLLGVLGLLATFSPQDPSVSDDAIRAHVKFLASDELAGRESGSEGFARAAEYVADHFSKAGLKRLDEKSPNVAALLEGSDAKLRDEIVVVGAHLDGLGRIGDVVFNGADDNASGVAGLLELARVLPKAKPRRSVLFVAFSGGEKGQAGSAAYLDAPPVPLDKTVAMLDLDMIGRTKGNYLFVGGTGTSPDWADRVKKHGEKAGLALETATGARSPTDSVNFHRRGVPVLWFFGNVHDDYHRPSDDAEKIDAASEAKILRMVLGVLTETAQAPKRPEFRKDESEAVPGDFYAKLAGGPPPAPRPKVRLGVNIEEVPGGVKLTSVQPDSAAGRAGLKVGDVILKVAGQKVANQPELLAELAKFKPGDKARLLISRGGQEREVEVEFKK